VGVGGESGRLNYTGEGGGFKLLEGGKERKPKKFGGEEIEICKELAERKTVDHPKSLKLKG